MSITTWDAGDDPPADGGRMDAAREAASDAPADDGAAPDASDAGAEAEAGSSCPLAACSADSPTLATCKNVDARFKAAYICPSDGDGGARVDVACSVYFLGTDQAGCAQVCCH